LLDKNLNVGKLKSLLKNRKRTLKSTLLDQKIISGIGNIYADEICFEAKLLPSRKVNTLNSQEIEKLYRAINKIISRAIKYRGTTFSDYTDAGGKKGNFSQFLKVYGQEKKKCQRCQKTLFKSKIAGRATKFCPNCQK
jgi:formamidopyrimidine-DNA glycosylase